MIIYEDAKGALGGYRILKSDLAKTKQGYNLGKTTILYATEDDEVKLSSIVALTKYNMKKDITVKKADIPLKKSPSSGKKL